MEAFVLGSVLWLSRLCLLIPSLSLPLLFLYPLPRFDITTPSENQQAFRNFSLPLLSSIGPPFSLILSSLSSPPPLWHHLKKQLGASFLQSCVLFLPFPPPRTSKPLSSSIQSHLLWLTVSRWIPRSPLRFGFFRRSRLPEASERIKATCRRSLSAFLLFFSLSRIDINLPMVP